MQSKRVLGAVAAAWFFGLLSVVGGQEPGRVLPRRLWHTAIPIQQPGQPVPATRGLTAKGLLGAAVTLQGNQAVGIIDDLVFGDDGVLDFLVVRSGNQLIPVPWAAVLFNSDLRTAVMNITPERFREVPTLTPAIVPNYADAAFRQRLYQAYGLEPGERRESRRP